MKKGRLLLIMIPVVAVAGFFAKQKFHRSLNSFRYDANQIGHSLLESQNSPLVVHIGNSTKEMIAAITNLNPSVNIEDGDEPRPIGDGRADFRIIYYNQNNQDLLGLRIKQTKESKYEVLGFWTPSRE